MTSKHLYFKLLREDAKRKLWAAALLGLAFFFILPVPLAMVLPSYQVTEYVTLEQIILRRTNNVRMMLGFNGGYPMVAVLMFFAAVVMGIATFSYLHNKKQIDFYHSLPVKRSLWFLVNLSTGVFLPAAIYLVAIVLSLIVGAVNGVLPGLVLKTAASSFLLNMLYYTLTYITVVLAMMLTGTKIAAILGSAVFFCFFPAVSALSRTYYQAFFQTYYSGTPDILSRTLLKLSPIAAIAMAMEDLNPVRIISVTAAILLLGIFAFFLYKKRPSEAAGKTMAFNTSKVIIKVPLVLAFGTAGAMFFYSIESSLGWTIFGNIVGVVLSHCIIEVIYWGDFKKLFSHEKTLAVCLAVSLAVLLSFYFDLFKFDAYVPEESQIAYASVDFNKDSWVYSRNFDPEMGADSILYQARLEDSADVLALVNEALRQMEVEAREGDTGRKRLEGEYRHRFRMDVCYTLKNHRKVYRSYVLYMDPVMETADRIYTDAAYKQALYPGLCLDESAAGNIVYRGWNDNIQHLDGSQQQWEAVLKAYQEEMAAMSFSRRIRENPFGELLLISSENIQTIENGRETDDIEPVHYQWGWYEGYYYPVYPSFAKTIQALEDCGVEMKELVSEEDVEDITISGYGPFDEEDEEDGEGDFAAAEWTKPVYEDDDDLLCQKTYDQIEDIEKILSACVIDEKGWRNGMTGIDGQYTLVIRVKGKGRNQVSGNFRIKEVPEFVVRDFVSLDKELREKYRAE